MMTNALGYYVSENGFASSILYHGQKVTHHIDATIEFLSQTGTSSFAFTLAHTYADTFIFTGEQITYRKQNAPKAYEKHLGNGGYDERVCS